MESNFLEINRPGALLVGQVRVLAETTHNSEENGKTVLFTGNMVEQ
jgi:hypothetical protein